MNRKERRRREQLEKRAAKETPTMEFDYDPNQLQGTGPIILTDVGITESHKNLLQKENLEVPQSVRCRLLIDTGATWSLVKHDIAEKAGLKLINASSPVHGIGVDTTGKTYLGRIWFNMPSKKAEGVKLSIAVDAPIRSANLSTDLIDGLIGRDVLRFFDFRYHGPSGKLVLRYLKK